MAAHAVNRLLPSSVNRWLALKITNAVGSMPCAYVFACLALVSLPSAIASGSPVTIVSWVSQTFLQLVLLSIIIVGQSVQAEAADARSKATFDDTTLILSELSAMRTQMATLSPPNGK